jgi:hypothetical protein
MIFASLKRREWNKYPISEQTAKMQIATNASRQAVFERTRGFLGKILKIMPDTPSVLRISEQGHFEIAPAVARPPAHYGKLYPRKPCFWGRAGIFYIILTWNKQSIITQHSGNIRFYKNASACSKIFMNNLRLFSKNIRPLFLNKILTRAALTLMPRKFHSRSFPVILKLGM